ncbi:DUF455 family protein [Paenibacillus sp. NPDC056579]|uniref:DUF455 family protein n=1 Tax=Paenibacillus sp. NPDC056579 TaxID=3345871 RepID=UPI0036CB1249
MSVNFEIERFESETMEHLLGDYWIRVSDQIQLLNRLIFFEWASARVIAGWVPAASEFDWKCVMSKMIWENMTIADRLRMRKEELSGKSKITIPSKRFHEFLQDASAAEGFVPFVSGWFMEVTKAVIETYEALQSRLDPIFDAPTLDILNEIITKKRNHLNWANGLVRDAVHRKEVLSSVGAWRKFIQHYLQQIGGIEEQNPANGASKPHSPVSTPHGPAPKKRSCPQWLKVGSYDVVPDQFKDSLKIFMWHYATEIQVLDPMCYVFYGVDDMPFEFYVDFSRHIWDESRHHLMGMRRLRQLGYDAKDIPVPYSEDALQELEYFYAMLTMVGESCSFTRKKKSMDAYYRKGDIISGMTAEIDIVDERSHVQFGKKWATAIYKQRFDRDVSLDDVVKEVMDRSMKERAADFENMGEAEKQSISQLAFCGKIEFKYLNYENL